MVTAWSARRTLASGSLLRPDSAAEVSAVNSVDDLRKLGVTEGVFITGYLKEKIEAIFGVLT